MVRGASRVDIPTGLLTKSDPGRLSRPADPHN
ncbi:MAG: hypothetical protein JWO83_360 [Caulobacteraceae bacterium]|nr:hypothetical protein [Caulobacteraceae bacterium]